MTHPHRVRPVTRRDFLARAAGAAVALSAGAPLLSACGNSSVTGTTAAGSDGPIGPGGLPLARPDRPVTLPIYDDNKAIASGLSPEEGPLQVLDWGDYIDPSVVKGFGEKYGVKTELTTIGSDSELISKISSGAINPDVFVPDIYVLDQLVAGKLVQPLNHDYIPNLANVWPQLQDPFYDQGSRYSVPDFVYSTGLIWRNDKLPGLDQHLGSDGWDVLWSETQAKDNVGILDSARESIAMAMYKLGMPDPNTEDSAALDKATAELQTLIADQNAKVQYTAFQQLATGTSWLNFTWSGDLVAAPSYLPDGVDETVLSWWFPSDGSGSVSNDFWMLGRSAENPVLGHMFMDYFLETEAALKNMAYVGYQVPLTDLTLDSMVSAGVASKYILEQIYLTGEDWATGKKLCQLTEAGTAAYDDAWAQVTSGA
jgi:spermidine/putrescine transport system substrate-binding protein